MKPLDEVQFRWTCQKCFKVYSPRKTPDNMSRERWIELFSQKHYKNCEGVKHEQKVVSLLHSWTCELCGRTYDTIVRRDPQMLDRRIKYNHMMRYHPEEFNKNKQIEDVICNSQNYVNKIDDTHYSWCCPICQKTHVSKSLYAIKNPIEWSNIIAHKHVEKYHQKTNT